jgi:hypothetical protein
MRKPISETTFSHASILYSRARDGMAGVDAAFSRMESRWERRSELDQTIDRRKRTVSMQSNSTWQQSQSPDCESAGRIVAVMSRIGAGHVDVEPERPRPQNPCTLEA